MKGYRFEIVRRKRRRFGWRVVALDGGRRYVLANSPRSYSSRKRARKGTKALRSAKFKDMTRPQAPKGFLRPTRFKRKKAVPLVLTQHSAYGLAGRRRRTR